MAFENGLNINRKDLIEFLDKARWMLIKVLLSTLVSGAILYIFSESILTFLQKPLGRPMVFYGVTEAFFAQLKIGFYGGLFVSIPYLFWNIWAVVRSILYREREKPSNIIVWVSGVLFYVGAAICFFIVLPSGMKFLMSYEREGLTAMISVGRYLSLSIALIFSFGFIFELPLIMLVLSRLGIVSVSFLNRNRRYAILLIAVISAVLTPTPDAYNMMLMAGPLIVLYEISVVLVWITGKKTSPASSDSVEDSEGAASDST